MAIADDYPAIALDIDGVLVRGETAIPGAAAALEALRARDHAVVLVTNNARRTPAEVADWLDAAGVPVGDTPVVTSAIATARLLDPGTRCLVIGMRGLRDALEARGCALTDDPDAAQAVVVGFDRTLTWDDLRRATTAIGRGVRFIGTNGDRTLPVEGDAIWPGNGAVLAALTAATGREPEIAGKPNRPLFDVAADMLGAAPRLFVGDRIETDIVGARAAGWDTALVLTGVTPRSEACSAPATFVVDAVGGILDGAA